MCAKVLGAPYHGTDFEIDDGFRLRWQPIAETQDYPLLTQAQIDNLAAKGDIPPLPKTVPIRPAVNHVLGGIWTTQPAGGTSFGNASFISFTPSLAAGNTIVYMMAVSGRITKIRFTASRTGTTQFLTAIENLRASLAGAEIRVAPAAVTWVASTSFNTIVGAWSQPLPSGAVSLTGLTPVPGTPFGAYSFEMAIDGGALQTAIGGDVQYSLFIVLGEPLADLVNSVLWEFFGEADL